LVNALLFKPDSELSSADAPDDLQIFFKSAKEKVAKLGKGSIYINTYPAGARIEIDGVFKGTTPLPVEGLKVGEHYVSAKLDGYSRFSLKIMVNDEFEEKYDFTLKHARKKKIFEDIAAKLRVNAVSDEIDGSASLTELKGMFFADYAILMDCRCKQTPPTLKMYFANLFTKKLISSIKYPQKSDAPEIDKTVVAGLVDEIFGAEEKRMKRLAEIAESAAGKPQKKSIFSKWWFWTLLGGAALGSVSAVLLLTKGGESEGFDHDGSGALIIRF
ncbi:MAG: PEGA domain-containing protein, partial [Deltaproteobacteria bacterium]|nr:PEGA domain-containing protein [Deltaproteobacteria bacterium]